MNPIDEKLFDYYCDPILRDAENFDESALKKAFDRLALPGEYHSKLIDVFFDNYFQWSLDAFTVGLHLGLSLHRPSPQGGKD